jgi:hypothetical protein
MVMGGPFKSDPFFVRFFFFNPILEAVLYRASIIFFAEIKLHKLKKEKESGCRRKKYA